MDWTGNLKEDVDSFHDIMAFLDEAAAFVASKQHVAKGAKLCILCIFDYYCSVECCFTQIST